MICDLLVTCQPRKGCSDRHVRGLRERSRQSGERCPSPSFCARARNSLPPCVDGGHASQVEQDGTMRLLCQSPTSHSVNNPRAEAAAMASTGVFAPIFASSVVIWTFISSSVTLKAFATSDECLASASH